MLPKLEVGVGRDGGMGGGTPACIEPTRARTEEMSKLGLPPAPPAKPSKGPNRLKAAA